MKIVSIEGEYLHIFWTTWETSMKFPVKMWLMIMLKIAKSWFLPLSRKHIFRKITWWGGGGGARLILQAFLRLSFLLFKKCFKYSSNLQTFPFVCWVYVLNINKNIFAEYLYWTLMKIFLLLFWIISIQNTSIFSLFTQISSLTSQSRHFLRSIQIPPDLPWLLVLCTLMHMLDVPLYTDYY